jgi:hypothetical protein
MGRSVKANPRGVVPPTLFSQETLDTDTTVTSNKIFFVDTSGGAVEVTLPAEPFTGDIIKIFDHTGSFGTNACTVDPNSHKIMGQADTMTVSTTRASFTLVYSGVANGWLVEAI